MHKLAYCLALLMLLASLLHAAVPGDLQLREDDNFWRLRSENQYYSYPNGGGNYSLDYYYNAVYPAQPDSIIYVHSDNIYYLLRHIYSRQNYSDYYEITINTRYDNGIQKDRTINRYNLQNQLIGYNYYEHDYGTEELEYQFRYEYAYDALGNVCSVIKYSASETITEMNEWMYNSSGLLTQRTGSLRNFSTGILEQYLHEERFYSQHTSPDSLHYWQNLDNLDSYTVYNSFDANGNVVYSENYRDASLEKTYSDYVYVEQTLYLPLHHHTYEYSINQGTFVPGDSIFTDYTYSNNYRTVQEDNMYNGEQTGHATYTYNGAWKLLSGSGSSISGSTWSGWGASYVWEFYSAVEDELVPVPDAALFVYPNPFKENAKLVYQTDKPGRASISIYNLKGQLVNSFSSDEQKAGEHSINITGCDKAGRALAAGVYIIRVVAGTKVQSARFLLLK